MSTTCAVGSTVAGIERRQLLEVLEDVAELLGERRFLLLAQLQARQQRDVPHLFATQGHALRLTQGRRGFNAEGAVSDQLAELSRAAELTAETG